MTHLSNADYWQLHEAFDCQNQDHVKIYRAIHWCVEKIENIEEEAYELAKEHAQKIEIDNPHTHALASIPNCDAIINERKIANINAALVEFSLCVKKCIDDADDISDMHYFRFPIKKWNLFTDEIRKKLINKGYKVHDRCDDKDDNNSTIIIKFHQL